MKPRNRVTYRNSIANRQPVVAQKKRRLLKPLTALLLLALIVGAALYVNAHKSNANGNTTTNQSSSTSPTTASQTATTPAPVNNCANNSLSQLILVSISKQHTWACEGSKQVYDSAVITGMELYPADLTPVGTYHIYAKQTDTHLAGHDSTGSWDDFVYYWMPFLDNKYGTYGFHDLTQTANGSNGRADSDFGNVNINLPSTAAKHGSHGCVELPLATAKWLYDWSSVGTTVTVES
jgi:lipoprotein-anchoring transpeptidase ErfK/SrfK